MYARLAVNHLGDHIPGLSAIVVQNRSGAGGMSALNYLYNVAPKDGTVLDIIPPALALSQVLRPAELQYDAAEAELARTAHLAQRGLLHVAHLPTRTMADLLRRETVTAGTGPDADSTVFTTLLNDLAGTRFKIINGYNETAAAMLAVERGEVEGALRPWEGMKAGRERDWLANDRFNLVRPVHHAAASRAAAGPDRQRIAQDRPAGAIRGSSLAPTRSDAR